MNLPNKLSVARVLCIPVIVTLLHFPEPACRIAAAALMPGYVKRNNPPFAQFQHRLVNRGCMLIDSVHFPLQLSRL